MPTANKLAQIRELMRQHHLDYYFIPSTDPHHNEYVPEHWQRRHWISHFSGSAGDVLIGLDKAYLWTDARYFLQAEYELDSNDFQLMRQQQDPSIEEWLAHHADHKKVGVDAQLMSINQLHKWQSLLKSAHGSLVILEDNLVDAVWQNRPSPKKSPIQVLDLQYTGKSVADKLQDIRSILQARKLDAHVITQLDAIAWLYNIRGQDIDYNPLIISYALVTLDKAYLFLDLDRLNDKDGEKIKKYFSDNHILVEAYNNFSKMLQDFKGRVLLDPKTASYWVEDQLKQATPVHRESPITLMKALKNPTEIKGMYEAHRRDAIALCKFFHWLENHWEEGVSELDAAQQLEAFRREDPHFQGSSFETISAFAEHSAIIHYRVTPETNKIIDNQHIYLLDSGGQYLEGTTDVTRTIHLGHPTEEERHHYTLVLKGHLALRHAVFPEFTYGENLDTLAREPLWIEGLNYGHGTGHGVGCFLCVHEGPQRIANAPSGVPLRKNMMVSNEPGVYFAGKYGIRIENVCLIKALEKYPNYETFDDLTKVPYFHNLISINILSDEEITWINDYHQQIYDLLKEDLPQDVRLWLKEVTRPITI